jgi:DNA-binding NarL/FixJ family response regulator
MTFGTRLTRLVLESEVAQNELPEQAAARHQFSRISDGLREALGAMDEVLWAVNPQRDTVRDFVTYICEYAQEYLQPAGIQCLLEVEPDMPSLDFDLPLRRSLLLAVKEAITNAAKHSGATQLLLKIQRQDSGLNVIVEDDGKGFDPAKSSGKRNGIGNMIQRMNEVGGRCAVVSEPGKGCRVEFSIPLTRQHSRPGWLTRRWHTRLEGEINPPGRPILKPLTNKTQNMKPQKTGTTAKPATQKVKIAIVEDQPEVRENWSKLINSFPDFECVCACVSGEEALREIPKFRPSVVLMDIFLPRMSGIECTAQIKELLPETRIIILTAMNDKELIFLALQAGADGYLLKRTKPADLRSALLDVIAGGSPMSSEIARRVVESFHRKAKTIDKSLNLSAREEEILVLLSKGYSNKAIADQLKLSVETIYSHLKRVYEKMHVHSRTEAVIRYLSTQGKV